VPFFADDWGEVPLSFQASSFPVALSLSLLLLGIYLIATRQLAFEAVTA
jgi:hypothetical protein